MAAFWQTIRRLFPPLKVKSTLWTSMALLTLYGLLVSWIVRTEHLRHIEWGAESTVLNGLVLGFLIGFRNNNAYALVGRSHPLGRADQSKPQPLSQSPDTGGRRRCGTRNGRAPRHRVQRRAQGPLAAARWIRRGAGRQNVEPHKPIRLAGEIYNAVLQWKRTAISMGGACCGSRDRSRA